MVQGARTAGILGQLVEEWGRRLGGVFQLYDQVAKRIALLPFVDPAQLDLRAFVSDRALDGLFSVLAREEARIREDPAARTTDLLQRVFGS